MGTRERILAIRLIEKAQANPAVAEKLGIVVENEFAWKKHEPEETEGE